MTGPFVEAKMLGGPNIWMDTTINAANIIRMEDGEISAGPIVTVHMADGSTIHVQGDRSSLVAKIEGTAATAPIPSRPFSGASGGRRPTYEPR